MSQHVYNNFFLLWNDDGKRFYFVENTHQKKYSNIKEKNYVVNGRIYYVVVYISC